MLIRHKQRSVTAVTPHNGRVIVPNRGAATLPPGLETVYSGALTVGADVTRTGYNDGTAGAAIGMFSFSPGNFGDVQPEFFYVINSTDKMFFGNNTLSSPMGFDPGKGIVVAVQGFTQNLPMVFGTTNWRRQNDEDLQLNSLLKKYLQTRIGAKLLVLMGQ